MHQLHMYESSFLKYLHKSLKFMLACVYAVGF